MSRAVLRMLPFSHLSISPVWTFHVGCSKCLYSKLYCSILFSWDVLTPNAWDRDWILAFFQYAFQNLLTILYIFNNMLFYIFSSEITREVRRRWASASPSERIVAGSIRGICRIFEKGCHNQRRRTATNQESIRRRCVCHCLKRLPPPWTLLKDFRFRSP